jgi:uncharacterized membrane protein
MTSKLPKTVVIIIIVSTIILFISSSVRHFLLSSSAFDLGWFDQALYLISQGENPIVSFAGFHILGDHAALIFYPIAILYKIYPNVHWLFAIQSLALALASAPIYYISIYQGLKESQAIAMVFVYLLYPLIFNINLFDFHPEVLAVPAILTAILAVKLDKIIWFCLALILTLSCKAVLSLTVIAMGIWLIFFDKKLYGAISLFAGISWFLIATKVIIPYFSGAEPAALGRYSDLGSSVFEIILNIFLKPGLILSKIFTLPNLWYIVLLFIPLIWGISIKHLQPLIATIPCISLNLLTNYEAQKDLIHQYSLPALPFLLLIVIYTLANGQGLIQNKKGIIIYALISFSALAKFGFFGSKYLETISTLSASKEAIALIQNTKEPVFTASQIAPHLTHRSVVKLAINDNESIDLKQFKYILLNYRHPGWNSNQELIKKLIHRINQNGKFALNYQKDEVYLFEKK